MAVHAGLLLFRSRGTPHTVKELIYWKANISGKKIKQFEMHSTGSK
jgi:hypothetical protein